MPVRRRAAVVATALVGKKKHNNKNRKSSVASAVSAVGHDDFRRTASGREEAEEEIHLPDDLPDDNNVLIMEAPHQIAERAREVEKILNKRLDKRAFVLDPEKNQVLIREKTIDSLIDKVEDRVFRARKYANTCLLICFLLIYLVMLFLQNDITQAFTMESSAANQIGVGLPPGFFLENADDFWNWLDGNVINKVFSDPSCGDGVCDIGESKGFGRFGCEQDCGRYLETTPISVNLVPYINASKDISPNWPWDNVPQRETPEYRWNIWSETMNDYIYAEDQVAGKGIVVVDVPDGKMSLKLYQTNKISEVVDTTTIQDYLGFSPPTVPPRQATNDFAYGDPREVIAASALLMKQVQDYCWGMDPSNFDFMCLLHPITDSLYKSLASYGLQGTVSMPNGTKDRIELVNAGFCGMLPNGTQGILNTDNKAKVVAARTSCFTARRDGDAFTDLIETERGMLGVRQEFVSALAARGGKEAQEGSIRKLLALSENMGPCSIHLDCDQSEIDFVTGNRGQFCNKGGLCDTCSFCNWDTDDAIDGACPLDLCPQGGLQPKCIDARSLVSNINSPKQCKDTYDFEIWNYNPKGSVVQVSDPPQEIVRWVTPFNRLVGPITVSTEKVKKGGCTAVQNRYVQNFTLGQCIVQEKNGQPYGMDPTYVATSAVYNGKLDVERYYSPHERYNRSMVRLVQTGNTAAYRVVEEATTPIGFFPHQYDTVNRAEKPSAEVLEKDRDQFKAYFDGMASAEQANAQLSYLRDGGFIDGETYRVRVDMVTYNAEHNMFMFLDYKFIWHQGGTIEWDYNSNTVFMDLYTSSDPTGSRFALEVICILCLALNIWLEVMDIYEAIKKFKLSSYISFYGNWFDWAHFVFMGYAWVIWFGHHQATSQFSMKSSYPVLADIGAPSRFFATNSTKEFEFLQFKEQIFEASGRLAYYQSLAGIVVICFVFRFLKTVDFQPRVGLVTRTITTALPDLCHFTGLFVIVFIGYAICANLLFGHQFNRMQDLQNSILFLLFMTFSMDKTAFYSQMTHAAPEWIFHLWFWTFTVVGYLVLFNIFLAILVDSYMSMREEVGKEYNKGVDAEIWDYIVHTYHRMFKNRNVFMSDQRVLEALKAHKAGLPSNAKVREAVLETIEHTDKVMLPGGVAVDKKWMWRLTHLFTNAADVNNRQDVMAEDKPNGRQRGLHSVTLESFEGAFIPGDESSDEEDVDQMDDETEEMIQDLLDRYGNEVNFDEKGQDDQALELMQVDSMKRQMGMFTAGEAIAGKLHRMELLMEGMMNKMLDMDKPENQMPPKIVDALAHHAQKVEMMNSASGSVKVVIVQAEGLPTMDLLRSVDPYAIVFLTDESGDSQMNGVQLKTTVQRKNRNPIWNEEFSLIVKRNSAAVTVAIYDKDNITKDDFVGCCFCTLLELDPYSEHDEWYPVLNPNMDVEGARVRLKITLMQDNKVTALSPQERKRRGQEAYLGENDSSPPRAEAPVVPLKRGLSVKMTGNMSRVHPNGAGGQ